MKTFMKVLLFFTLITMILLIVWQADKINKLKTKLEYCDSGKIISSLRNHLKESEDQLSMCRRTNEAYSQDVEHYQDRIEALIAAGERKNQEIRILSEK